MSQQVISQAAPDSRVTTDGANPATPAGHVTTEVANAAVPDKAVVGEVVTAQQSKWQQLGSFLGDWLLRRYSAVRVIARMKVLTFTLLLTFLGLGFVLKVATLNAATGVIGPVEFILASPGPVESVSATIAFLFVASANIYSMIRRQKDEREMIKVAADPLTPPEVRNAILLKLQGR